MLLRTVCTLMIIMMVRANIVVTTVATTRNVECISHNDNVNVSTYF